MQGGGAEPPEEQQKSTMGPLPSNLCGGDTTGCGTGSFHFQREYRMRPPGKTKMRWPSGLSSDSCLELSSFICVEATCR